MTSSYKLLAYISAIVLTVSAPHIAFAQKLCVFDPAGKSGQIYAFMTDYAIAAKKWGTSLNVDVSVDENNVVAQYKANQCDAMLITGLRSREFNGFTGSIDILGATPNQQIAQNILTLISSTKLASKMKTSKGDEVAGVTPLGSYYLYLKDRTSNSIGKFTGRRFGVIDYDSTQIKIIQRLGSVPIPLPINQMTNQFNNKQLDIMPMPAFGYTLFSLEKGLSTQGGILQYPVGYLTASIVIKSDRFPKNYGQNSREWIAAQLNNRFTWVAKQEAQVPAKYWVTLPLNDKLNYARLMQDVRNRLVNQGLVDTEMMQILTKIRCITPTSSECAVTK